MESESLINQAPVVLGIVSWTSPLRGQLIKFSTCLYSDTLFLVEKMREPFALHYYIIMTKNIGILRY